MVGGLQRPLGRPDSGCKKTPGTIAGSSQIRGPSTLPGCGSRPRPRHLVGAQGSTWPGQDTWLGGEAHLRPQRSRWLQDDTQSRECRRTGGCEHLEESVVSLFTEKGSYKNRRHVQN